MTTETIKLTCPIFDQDGNETGSEVIEVTELESTNETLGLGDGSFRKVQQVELSEIKHAHMDDVAATLDEYYGYFKYQIV